MVEVLLAAGIVLSLLLPAWLTAGVGVATVLSYNVWLVALGFAFGLPFALVYHIRLARVLTARSALPRGWWYNPTALHSHLLPHERRQVLLWFVLGGCGFMVVVTGCAGFVIALLQWAGRA